MRCPNCGKKIPDGSQSCPGCKTIFRIKTVQNNALSDPQLGRLLYFGLFVSAALITVFIYLKWQTTGIGESYSLAKMTEMYANDSKIAGWFTNATYVVLCLQLLAVVMWIITYSKPSPVIPLLAGGVTLIGTLAFLIMAIFGLGEAFQKIPNFTRTASVIPYLTLLLSAGEIACAWLSPKLLKAVPGEAVRTEKTTGQSKIAHAGNESAKKLLDELDGTVIRDENKSNGVKHGGK